MLCKVCFFGFDKLVFSFTVMCLVAMAPRCVHDVAQLCYELKHVVKEQMDLFNQCIYDSSQFYMAFHKKTH